MAGAGVGLGVGVEVDVGVGLSTFKLRPRHRDAALEIDWLARRGLSQSEAMLLQ